MIKIKQNITLEQLEELSTIQIKNLWLYWWFTKKPDVVNPLTQTANIESDTGILAVLPLLSIGDMIEYLRTHNHPLCMKENVIDGQRIWYIENGFAFSENEELCDCLWELTKGYLIK